MSNIRSGQNKITAKIVIYFDILLVIPCKLLGRLCGIWNCSVDVCCIYSSTFGVSCLDVCVIY